MEWFKHTLQTYPEIAVMLSLAIGFWVGGKKFKGFSLGSVTGTLLAAVVVGQLDITVTGPLKSLFFLMFLFAVGYSIGPQFVQGLAHDGLPQAAFAAIQALLSLGYMVLIAKIAGLDLGAAAGLFAGSQTISASMGLATDAINRTGLPPDQIKQMMANMPVAYAICYIFGTLGSALLMAKIMPPLMGIDLKKASKEYEELHRESGAAPVVDGAAWHEYELRAYRISHCAESMTVGRLEHRVPGRHLFVEAIRRGEELVEISSSTPLKPGDVLAIGGDHKSLVELPGEDHALEEVEDFSLLNQPVSGLDVFVSNKAVNGKTLAELAEQASAHGVFVRRIKRGMGGTEIPVLANTRLHRADVVTLFGLEKNVRQAAKTLGVVDERGDSADVAFLALAMVIGTLIGAASVKVGGVPLTISTAGGSLIAGLIFGWIRSVRPTFGYIPSSTAWFMNSVGLNVFIAVIGLSTGPTFVQGLKEMGFGVFLWGIAATSLPLVTSAFIGRYIFKFHPAILFGCCAGARTLTAGLGMVNEAAESNVASLGYTVTYAVGNMMLTLWGLVLILILA